MRCTEVWNQFTADAQQVIRKALRQKAGERSEQAKRLLREFWRAHKRRTRDRLPALDNHRINHAYRKWLRKKGLPVQFNQQTYQEFRRIHGSCSS